MSKPNFSKEQIRHICLVFCGKSKDTSQAAVNVNIIYGADNVTINQAKFRFRRCRSRNSDFILHR